MTPLLAGAATAVGVLHAIDPAPEEGDVRPGGMYAVIIIGLIVVLVLLWLSLRKHLGRIDVDRADRDSSQHPDGPSA